MQLSTRTKMFCGCRTAFGDPPNTNVCPTCLGLPGALPVPNAEAMRLGARGPRWRWAAPCIGTSVFARKNYFYPDLPKGYQISQFDQPLATGGRVALRVARAGPDRGRHHPTSPGGGRRQAGARPFPGKDRGGPQPRRHAAGRDRERAGHALARRGARLPGDAPADPGVRRRERLQHGAGEPPGRRQHLHPPAGRAAGSAPRPR